MTTQFFLLNLFILICVHSGKSQNLRVEGEVTMDISGGDGWSIVKNDSIRAIAGIYNSGVGLVGSLGPNSNWNSILSYIINNENHGALTVRNPNGVSRAVSYAAPSGPGHVVTYGDNDSLNVFLASLSGLPNHGFIGIYNSSGTLKGSFYVDGNGDSQLEVDNVMSLVSNPEKSHEKIRYSVLQGPEEATFLRGTAQLINGRISVNLPKHFAHLIDEDSMTVQVTPCDPNSKGLAVIERTSSRFIVTELFQGQGNYTFDWEVKAEKKKKSIHKRSITGSAGQPYRTASPKQ